MSSGPSLESLVDQTISVITNDGRNIVGVLKGFDQATNIILDESHERVFSTKVCIFTVTFVIFLRTFSILSFNWCNCVSSLLPDTLLIGVLLPKYYIQNIYSFYCPTYTLVTSCYF
ncbi:unnamed protein product [Prunus brigantina]